MTTNFEHLPLVDLSPLRSESPAEDDLRVLSDRLHEVFATTGFAYLVNVPLSFSHDDVFSLAGRFFQLDEREKMQLARKAFVSSNENTYRGYFPPNPGQEDNLKEGFEVGGSQPEHQRNASRREPPPSRVFDLSEPNVWPEESLYPGGRSDLERLHVELQTLSCKLLSLLAQSLGKPADFFSPYLHNSVSTLRLLHYPSQGPESTVSSLSNDAGEPAEVKLCCTPHTDSGILTLLHQDPTGGLEVRNAAGAWIPAPYIPGSIVVNIGDLLSQVSGGRFVATMHRVRASAGAGGGEGKAVKEDSGGAVRLGRLSVPFFFEPGEACVVKSVDDDGEGARGVVYGEHVRRKMAGWVEFQDQVAAPVVSMPPPASMAIDIKAG